MNLPTLVAPKGRMTEAEARVVGASANRIVNLRGLQATSKGLGSMSVATTTGQVALTLTAEDIQACLALLIEREAALLVSFDIELAN